MIGLSPSDNNQQINNYKQQHNLTLYAAGTQGGGPAAIDVVISGQTFLGYPTYCVVCPDKTMSFDVCWPPTVPCFDPYIQDCGVGSIAASFSADETEVCPEGTVNFQDESTGDITSWEWTFEGGEPNTSTEQNPAVIYNSPGNWDITLTVSDGSGSNTTEMQDYITVHPNPIVLLNLSDTVCLNWPAYELTAGMPEGGDYSGTGVNNGFFDPAAAGNGWHEITYTYINSFGCEGFAVDSLYVDLCTGIFSAESESTLIYPNPASGQVSVCSGREIRKVKVYNYTGQLMIEKFTTGKTVRININDLQKGVYLFLIQTRNETIAKHVIVE